MYLSDIGKIVKNEWLKTAEIRKNVKLDEFIIMPNHLHGILIIDNDNHHRRGEATPRLYDGGGTDYDGKHPQMSKISPKPGSLSTIVGSFKSICTKKIRASGFEFTWQSRFYDHIIRDDKSLDNIRQYIIENPRRWGKDKNNPEGLYL